MAQPNPYNRVYNFSNYQAENPNDPLPANQVDAELNALKVVTDQIRVSIAQMQRDDYALKNNSVGFDQLKPELDGFGFNPPTAWAPSTAYIFRDTVFFAAGFYQCLVSHTSTSDFGTDEGNGYWELVADFTSIVNQTDASNLTTGTLPDARLSFTVSTFIRDLLDDTSQAAARSTIGAVSMADVAAAYQPLDSDLTAIAALTTTSYGRGLLETASGSALFADIKQAATTSATGVVEKAVNSEVFSAANDKFISTDLIETSSAMVQLTDASTVAVDWDTFINGYVVLAGNREIGNPTNGQPGTYRTIELRGDGTTDRSPTFGSNYHGDLPVLADVDSGKYYLLTIRCMETDRFLVTAQVSKKP